MEFRAAGDAWLPASVRRFDAAAGLYDLSVAVSEDRVRRLEKRPAPRARVPRRSGKVAPANQQIDDFAADVDQLLERMQQAAWECQAWWSEHDRGCGAGSPRRAPHPPGFSPAEDVEYRVDGVTPWVPAIVRAYHVAGGQPVGQCELSVLAAPEDVRVVAGKETSLSKCSSVATGEEGRFQSFNRLLNGSHQLEEQLHAAADQVKQLAGLCGVPASGAPCGAPCDVPVARGAVSRRQVLRPSSAGRWALRRGQFGLVRTAWHGPAELELPPEPAGKEPAGSFWETDGRHLWC